MQVYYDDTEEAGQVEDQKFQNERFQNELKYLLKMLDRKGILDATL